jgi:hypothetical protein
LADSWPKPGPSYSGLLNDLTGDNRPPPYAFNNSANALEDVLGLSSTLSRGLSLTVAVDGAAAVTTITIVGSGKSFAFSYFVPPTAALFYLIVTTHTLW